MDKTIRVDSIYRANPSDEAVLAGTGTLPLAGLGALLLGSSNPGCVWTGAAMLASPVVLLVGAIVGSHVVHHSVHYEHQRDRLDPGLRYDVRWGTGAISETTSESSEFNAWDLRKYANSLKVSDTTLSVVVHGASTDSSRVQFPLDVLRSWNPMMSAATAGVPVARSPDQDPFVGCWKCVVDKQPTWGNSEQGHIQNCNIGEVIQVMFDSVKCSYWGYVSVQSDSPTREYRGGIGSIPWIATEYKPMGLPNVWVFEGTQLVQENVRVTPTMTKAVLDQSFCSWNLAVLDGTARSENFAAFFGSHALAGDTVLLMDPGGEGWVKVQQWSKSLFKAFHRERPLWQ
jgi:hypothetical protein